MASHCVRCSLLQLNSGLSLEACRFTTRLLVLRSAQINNRHSTALECRRNLSTSSLLLKSVHVPSLNVANVNMQKKLQIKYSEDYIQQKIEEYELGVRRLAVMMGEDPTSFTENDVEKAICYLFPSDLFYKPARPRMDHPSKVFPASHKIQADKDGRPFHYLYYTPFQEVYALMNQAYIHVLEAQAMEDAMDKKDELPEPLDLSQSKWLSAAELDAMAPSRNKLPERVHAQFIAQMDRLVAEPFAGKFLDFIMKFRIPLPLQTISKDSIPRIETDEMGREFVFTEGIRKTAIAKVKLYSKGSGIVTINGALMREFFNLISDREVVITPFTFVGLLRKFDVDATVDGGFAGNWTMLNGFIYSFDGTNKSAMAGAIRLAIARGLLAFVDEDQAEQMRRAGLLTEDPRRRERKKPGQAGARKKFTWKKR